MPYIYIYIYVYIYVRVGISWSVRAQLCSEAMIRLEMRSSAGKLMFLLFVSLTLVLTP